MRKTILFLFAGLLFASNLIAQQPKKYNATEIFEAIQKLNFLGSALYIAAHPDDENTRLISYLSNDLKARTAYLSLTRGDGGQNLIGPELRELLGVLRSEELLAARRIDGGEQFFSRANDFGYSKHPDETLAIWNKEAVLSDVVWTIRNFRPDIIINRFDHRSPGTTHGHHTSSAMLSFEAYDLAANPDKFSDQLNYTAPWQPKRLFFNTSWWFYGSQENFEKADKTNLLEFEIGNYYPLRGVSNNEIAALSRSQHRSQGFGSMGSRGSQTEYLEFLKGDMPKDKTNLFEGINTTWSRVKNGEAIGKILGKIEENFNFKDPSSHLPHLLNAYGHINKIEDDYWRALKLKEIKQIITACAGLYLEAVANDVSANPGDQITLSIEAINRSDSAIILKSISTNLNNSQQGLNTPLNNNEKQDIELEVVLPDTLSYTAPYWLTKKAELGMYMVKDQNLIGKPETPRALSVTFNLVFDNSITLPIVKDVIYKYSDPAKGEVYQPFEILPPVAAAFENKVNIFSDAQPKDISLKVRAVKDNITGIISLDLPEGWEVHPAVINFNIKNKGEEKAVTFNVTPPSNENVATIKPLVRINGDAYSGALTEIAYDHIPTQTVLMPSEAKVVRINIEKAGENIGYIVGAGDAVPESLQQIGYNVMTIAPEDINAENLKRFDAVVVGIRAYNIVDELKFKQSFLLEYVKQGGTVIVQYNTTWRGGDFPVKNLAPYELKLSRDRVTDENSEVNIIAKNHSLINFPNKITQNDFNGWVQERGLYFPNQWGAEFSPILSMNDKGESAKKGSLLVAPYGKGYYIYTGLSFFRELPAGVPGAYKLFTNMLSIGKEQVKTDDKKIKG
ncbi:GlcNAc-PI de-N-acetylase [Zhouia amylolytica]|uniref:GlcNAc-PI de-N-acetylase n=1 Tax=Zhouia amylolytica TaxID=376730 RepID=A0A1I6TEL5_9FLAO|nr:PIG-L family deacetylase [Zhouia amylolytica]SFS87605.1 GlcNAc-PI de-N-acetylase [Zhouia amylolytica]